VKSRIHYKGPLLLYVSYYVLFALAITLLLLSARADSGSALFIQLAATGMLAAMISVSLILHSTQIERKINQSSWRQNAENYYNDEGVFEYTHNGFSIITKEGKSLNIPWQDIIRIDSREEKTKNQLRVSFIDLFFTERDLLSVDSSMPGFTLFEKRLKGNMRYLWKDEQQRDTQDATEKKTAQFS